MLLFHGGFLVIYFYVSIILKGAGAGKYSVPDLKTLDISEQVIYFLFPSLFLHSIFLMIITTILHGIFYIVLQGIMDFMDPGMREKLRMICRSRPTGSVALRGDTWEPQIETK